MAGQNLPRVFYLAYDFNPNFSSIFAYVPVSNELSMGNKKNSRLPPDKKIRKAKGTAMDSQKKHVTSRHLFAPSPPHASGSSSPRLQFSWHRWLGIFLVTQTGNHSAGLPVSTKVAMAKLGTGRLSNSLSVCCVYILGDTVDPR